VERRLAAILAADVVGYSRLMRDDEVGTFERLKSHRRELIDPKIAECHGRIVKLMGDGALVEFASVVDAVSCAVDIQREMAVRNAESPIARHIEFRIGINVGDVIVEGNDIYGDGVNIASRLENLAEPGGICLSGDAYRQVRGKIDATFEDLGEREVKNVAEPIRVYAIAPAGVAAVPTSWAADALPLPSKPSIAVLPFINMSGDPEQEYLADGITADLITAFSKIRWFFVIARNSTFAYKGQTIDVKEVGTKLGVRYVVEGSVRRAGNRVRISVQLIEVATGRHVWAERYDRNLEDIFALQDEMTETIVRAIEPELGSAERERAMRRAPGSLDAWGLLQRGLWHHYRFSKQDSAEAQRLFQQSIKIDPNFALAHAALAHACYWDALFGFTPDVGTKLAEGLEHARRAVSLDDKEPFAHFALGRIQTLSGELDVAIAELEQAIELNSNFAHAYLGLGFALILAGRPAEALDQIIAAIRLNPHDPSIWTFLNNRALALFFLDRSKEAVEWIRRSAQSAPTILWSHVTEAVILADLGREQEAAAALVRARPLMPDFSADFIRSVFPLRNPTHHRRFMEALAKAGMPE
jgi:adenylate cyclase